MKRHWMRIGISFFVLGVVGCVGSVSPSGAEREAKPLLEAAEGEGTRLTPTPLPALERVPATEATFASGEVPEGLLADVLDDLEEQTGVQREAIQVVRAEAVVWNDGSLGCPQPGLMYTQALVEGYRVVLEADGESYAYHANDRGRFFLCDGGVTKLGPPPSLVEDEGEMTPRAGVPLSLQRFVDQALADLAGRLAIEAAQIEVIEAKEVVWPDASLGCPQPGMAYIQIAFDGLMIRLRVGERVFAYHSGGGRDPFLCDPSVTQKYTPPQLDLEDIITPPPPTDP